MTKIPSDLLEQIEGIAEDGGDALPQALVFLTSETNHAQWPTHHRHRRRSFARAGVQNRTDPMTTNDMYIRLNHEQYKNVEDQLRRFDELETTHRTVEGGYHKAFRLHITETFVLELQGPLIKPPLEMTDETAAGCFHKWYSTDYDMDFQPRTECGF